MSICMANGVTANSELFNSMIIKDMLLSLFVTDPKHKIRISYVDSSKYFLHLIDTFDLYFDESYDKINIYNKLVTNNNFIVDDYPDSFILYNDLFRLTFIKRSNSKDMGSMCTSLNIKELVNYLQINLNNIDYQYFIDDINRDIIDYTFEYEILKNKIDFLHKKKENFLERIGVPLEFE